MSIAPAYAQSFPTGGETDSCTILILKVMNNDD